MKKIRASGEILMKKGAKKKIGCFLLIVAMTFILLVPAEAADVLCTEDIEQQKIDELVSLAAKAARNGEIDLAYEYEAQIELLGTEVLSREEIKAFEIEMNGGSAELYSSEINPPSDKSRVHFYKTTSNNYRYNNKYYDIITIRAVSWDDTADWLHMKGVLKTNSPSLYTVASSLGTTVVGTVLGEVNSPLMTVSDILSAIGEGASQYTTLSIGKGEGVCTYAVDMEVKFQWIRSHGNGDFTLRVRESRYSEINYSTTLLTTATLKNGSTKTYTISKDFEKSYTPSNYGSLSRVCQIFAADGEAVYPTPEFTISVGSNTVIIPSMTVPPNMDII